VAGWATMVEDDGMVESSCRDGEGGGEGVVAAS
jgi:hypothetical protein